MRPSGRIGRVFGWLMARGNKPAYRWATGQLRAVKPESVLEIGFGTGHLLKKIIKEFQPLRVAGRDPSPLMVETAQKRLSRLGGTVALDLSQGDDTTLPAGPFDAIVALHSFQFWADPETTLPKLRASLSSQGRLILVLRRHSWFAARKLPNPLSRSKDEISAVIAAAAEAGFTLSGMGGISKHSHGLVFACG
jgi:SAM-dependent methyltransferase